MTARVQSLRSSTKGARPPAGRAVGELYTNFVDKQIGVVGPAGNIDLVPVRFFSETTDYAIGDLVARAGNIYRAAVIVTAGAWDGTKWTDIVNEAENHIGVVLFDASKPYRNGDLVAHNGDIWVANSVIPAGAFNPAAWTLKTSAVGVVQFELTKNYLKDQLVAYQGKVYRAKAAWTAAAWDATKWEDISTPSDAVRAFDATATYAANDLVSNAGKIYRATGAVAAGAWNAANWEDISTPSDAVRIFDATKAYVLNDLVSNAGKIYRAIAAVPAGAFNTAQWTDINTNLTDAIRSFDATKAYIQNDIVWNAGKIYRADAAIAAGAFDATKWTEVSVGPLTKGRVPFVGDHGIIDDAELAYDATKNNLTVGGTVVMGSAYGFRNKLINGDMRIDQRNAGKAAVAGFGYAYNVDRWYVNSSQGGKLNVMQNANGVKPTTEFEHCLGVVVGQAQTVGAADYSAIGQRIEGQTLIGLDWGKPTAKAVVLSFWANCSVGGLFGGSIRDSVLGLSFPFSFNLTAGTWTKVVIPISGPTTGTWHTDNGMGAEVNFSLGAGASFQAPANAWVGGAQGPSLTTPGAVNILGTVNASYLITGIQLEEGTVATPFEHRPIGLELQLCQRYYEVLSATIMGTNPGVNYSYVAWFFKTTMRVAPTVNANINGGTINATTTDFFQINMNSNHTIISSGATASSEL